MTIMQSMIDKNHDTLSTILKINQTEKIYFLHQRDLKRDVMRHLATASVFYVMGTSWDSTNHRGYPTRA